MSSIFSSSTHAHYKPVENCVKIEHDANRSTFQLRSRSEAHFCAHAVNVGNVRPSHLREQSIGASRRPPHSASQVSGSREGGRGVSPLHACFCGGFSPPTLVRDPGSRRICNTYKVCRIFETSVRKYLRHIQRKQRQVCTERNTFFNFLARKTDGSKSQFQVQKNREAICAPGCAHGSELRGRGPPTGKGEDETRSEDNQVVQKRKRKGLFHRSSRFSPVSSFPLPCRQLQLRLKEFEFRLRRRRSNSPPFLYTALFSAFFCRPKLLHCIRGKKEGERGN